MKNNIDYGTLVQVNERIKLLIEYLKIKKELNHASNDESGNP